MNYAAFVKLSATYPELKVCVVNRKVQNRYYPLRYHQNIPFSLVNAASICFIFVLHKIRVCSTHRGSPSNGRVKGLYLVFERGTALTERPLIECLLPYPHLYPSPRRQLVQIVSQISQPKNLCRGILPSSWLTTGRGPSEATTSTIKYPRI